MRNEWSVLFYGLAVGLLGCSSNDMLSWDLGTTPLDHLPMTADPAPDLAFKPPRLHKSGTRVKAVYYETADGTSELAYWFDTERMTKCQWVLAEDGTVRCLPLSLPVRFFSDAKCTEGVLAVSEICGSKWQRSNTPRGARVSGFGTPSRLSMVFRKRRPNEPPSGSAQGIDACIATTAPVNETFVAPADPLPPTEFVRLLDREVTPLHEGDRIASLTQGTEDGGRVWLGLFDTKQERACYPRMAEDGFVRCLPGRIGSPGYFSDNTCSLSLFALSSASPGAPFVYVDEDVVRTCKTGSSVRKLVPFTGTAYTLKGTCVPVEATPEYRLYAVSDKIPATDFEVLEKKVGVQRVSRSWYATKGGLLESTFALNDTVLKAECSFMATADGATRCLPKQRLVSLLPGDGPTYFFDSNCEMPTVASNPFSCSILPEPRATVVGGSRCAATGRGFDMNLGRQRSSPEFMRADDGTCKPLPPNFGAGHHISVAAPISDEAFQAAEIRMD